MYQTALISFTYSGDTMRRKWPPAVWVTPDLQISRDLLTDLVSLHHLKFVIVDQFRVIVRLEHKSPSFDDGEAIFQYVTHVVERLVLLHLWKFTLHKVDVLLLNVPLWILCFINRVRTFLKFFSNFNEKFLLL